MFKSNQTDISWWRQTICRSVDEVFRIIVSWIKNGGRVRETNMAGEAGVFQAELVTDGERTQLASCLSGALDSEPLQALRDSVDEQIVCLLANPGLRCSREHAGPFTHENGAAIGFELGDGRIVIFAFAGHRQRADADEATVLSIAVKAALTSGREISVYSETRKNSFLASLVSTMHRIDRDNHPGF